MPRLRRSRRLLLGVGTVLLLAPLLMIAAYRVIDPPITPLMLIRLAEGERLDHRSVALSRISPNLVDAVIASEDNLFCRHFGFDTNAIADEFDDWMAGGRPRGASTISMQTAKNILLWPGRDIVRKGIEAWLTPQIEILWGKRRILEVYLNVIEMGPGVYGAEAAAHYYFDKPASELSRREAALLAAILPNPREWSAAHPSAYINGKATRILRRIDQLGPLLDCANADATSGSRDIAPLLAMI